MEIDVLKQRVITLERKVGELKDNPQPSISIC